MSSVISEIAQVGRRIGYFRAVADVSGYAVSTVTFDVKGITALGSAVNIASSAGLLEDMGGLYQFNGQIFRSVRVVSQNPAGGNAVQYLICMPGGEYPVHGVAAAGAIVPAAVVRLG
jgi:hypothetical protein